jgi:hypothetical protein
MHILTLGGVCHVLTHEDMIAFYNRRLSGAPLLAADDHVHHCDSCGKRLELFEEARQLANLYLAGVGDMFFPKFVCPDLDAEGNVFRVSFGRRGDSVEVGFLLIDLDGWDVAMVADSLENPKVSALTGSGAGVDMSPALT